MKILALETDVERIKERYCTGEEKPVLFTYYHGLSFFFAILREIMVTILFFAMGILAWIYAFSMLWVVGLLFLGWLLFVTFNVINAYIDWSYDFLFVTTDKLVLSDQTSFIRQKLKPIHLENVGGISTDTQFWGMFPFGILQLHLKEGLGGDTMTLRYVPHVEEVAATIAQVVTDFQRTQTKADEIAPAAPTPAA